MRSNREGLLPSQHKKAVFTFTVLLPLVYYIPPWLTENLTDSHLLVTALSLAIIVPIVSYIALPLFFKALELQSRFGQQNHRTL
jgi:hypothetical protein